MSANNPHLPWPKYDIAQIDAIDLNLGLSAIASQCSGGDVAARRQSANRCALMTDALAREDHREAGRLLADWLIKELA